MNTAVRIGLQSVALLIAGVLVLSSGCAPEMVSSPESYANFNSREGTFAMEYPEGWTADGNGNRSRGVAWAKFEKGPIEIRIDASFTDSLGGDIPTDNDTPDELKPEALLQQHYLEYYQDKFSGYSQDEGETIRTSLGPTRMNKFTGSQGFSKIKGIRASIMGHDRGVTFLAHCPENQWETFEPVFDRMLRSMKVGRQE